MNNGCKRFSCDVDGILNDYPICWLRYLSKKCGTLYETVSLAKKKEIDYRRFKDDYRNSSFKANLPVWRKNRDVINMLVAKGLDSVIVTSRPILNNKYVGLYDRTFLWLKNNNISFSDFEYKDPDAVFLDKYPQIRFHIDDDPAYALKVAKRGIKVYLLKNDNWDFSCLNGKDESKMIYIINDLEDILKYESIL